MAVVLLSKRTDNTSFPHLSQATTFTTSQSSSRPSTPGPAPAASYNYTFPSTNDNQVTFQLQTDQSNSNNSALNQGLENFLAFPGSNNNPRPRALSDTSVRPVMATVESQPAMPSSFMGSHPSIVAGHFSPSLSAQAPPLSSMGRTMANHRSNSFGSSDAIHFDPHHDAAYNNLDVGLGADLRRAHRPSRSEDYNRRSPFQPIELLQPSAAYGQANSPYMYASSIRSHDSMGTAMPSSIGPTRHGRRLSGSPYSDRPGSISSARASPYPSPSGSPAHIHQGLPSMQDSMNHSNPDLNNPDGNQWSKVERQQVTTPATAKASEGRRKGEASFVCPVPGCGSTFTRHFNLKGKMTVRNTHTY